MTASAIDGTAPALGARVVRLTVVLRTSTETVPQLVDALQSMIIPTRFEPGCVGCLLWTEEGRTIVVNYIEEWVDEDSIRARVRSDRFTRLLAALEVATEPPQIRFDFERETRGLDYVAAARGRPGH